MNFLIPLDLIMFYSSFSLLQNLTFKVIKKIREEMIVRQISDLARLFAYGATNDGRDLLRKNVTAAAHGNYLKINSKP